MPKLLRANVAGDPAEERRIRRLAQSRHAPGDWILRARMIVRSWDGLPTTAIAEELGCHPQTVRERIIRFNAEGLDGLGDRPGPGRKPRLTEAERSQIIALAQSRPPGSIVRESDGTLVTADDEVGAHWTLDALVEAAHERGIRIERSQVRRILRREKVRWRATHSWGESTDPDCSPKGRRSSHSTPRRRRMGRSSRSTNSVRSSRGAFHLLPAGRWMAIGSKLRWNTVGAWRRFGSMARCASVMGTR
jgi:transposase